VWGVKGALGLGFHELGFPPLFNLWKTLFFLLWNRKCTFKRMHYQFLTLWSGDPAHWAQLFPVKYDYLFCDVSQSCGLKTDFVVVFETVPWYIFIYKYIIYI
jgi:hypothetical protein